MSKRKQAKVSTRWSEEVQQRVTAAGRDLALDLYCNRESTSDPTKSVSSSMSARGYGPRLLLDSIWRIGGR
jgi:hypothetical protein